MSAGFIVYIFVGLVCLISCEASCRGDPPPIANGRAVVRYRHHGYVIWYTCDEGFEKVSDGQVRCVFGSWTGNTPACGDTRCNKETLNYPGLIHSEGFLLNGGSFEPVCLSGYEVTEGADKRIRCVQGKWSGNLPPCTIGRCKTEDLAGFSGLVLQGYRTFDEGESMQPLCSKGFEYFDKHDSKLYCREGAWRGTMPPCIPARCLHNPPVPENGRIKLISAVNHGSVIEYECSTSFEMVADGNVVCSYGQWTGSLPECKDRRCKTEDLAGFSGLVLQGYRTFDEGESMQPLCSKGFEYFDKHDSKLYCREGAWRGTMPPCIPARCLYNPPVPENGRIKLIRAVNHGSATEYECSTSFEMVGDGNVVCNYGQWTGSLPECKDSRCYLRDLPQKDGVVLTNDRPISSHSKAHIVCIRGYSLNFPEVYCERGEWKMENALSPCQENGCVVAAISNGEILKERNETIKNYWGFVIGTKTVRDTAVIGSFHTSGNSLYVECNERYRFQGSEAGQMRIVCRGGDWTPFPVCELPGTLEEANISTADEAVNAPSSFIVTSEFLTESSSANASEEVDFYDILSISDSNSTENEQLALTNPVTDPPCSCKYAVQDGVLIAHDGRKIIQYGEEIPSGSILTFYCNTTGYFRLKGLRSSLECPADCQWHSSVFPSCVSPGDNDVVMRVFATPPENMEVGPGGVLAVITTTRLVFTCRVKNGYRESVDWSVPAGADGFKKPVKATDSHRIQYVVPQVSSRASGKYTCYKKDGLFHSVDIEVKVPVCPEIDSAEDMAVSYSPNRNFGSRATFHCSYPYKRNGPSYVTCEASGMWSGPPASCELPTCPMETFFDVIPEGVVPLIEGEISENVPYGYVMKLSCDESGRILKGINTVVCGAEGKWRAGQNLKCIRGCGSPQRENTTELLIFPRKEIYKMGESITFACPKGKTLTGDVERIMCFTDGWTPNVIPDCQ